MKTRSLHAGRTRAEVIENTGFEMLFADDVSETPPSTEEKLRTSRMEVDPKYVIIGK